METIASRHNPTVRTFRSLARHRSGGQVLLEGEHLVREALDAGVQIVTAALAARLLERSSHPRLQTVHQLADRLRNSGARVLSVSEQVMAAMSPVQTPSGIVAIAEAALPPLQRVVRDGTAAPLLVILAGVQDPGNLGGVVRTAEAAGATGLVACEPSADPYSWKALRGAMGSTFRLPVPERVTAEIAVAEARRQGLRIVAAVPRGGTSMHEADFLRPLAVMLGGEGGGLAADLLDHADERLTVPMKAPVESLNVGISAAVILYEAYRQRLQGVRTP
jgi:TrmH family RNA methyltransferase